jgi:S-DNA-T family DNA segregation ATPase FtsK/SpoIIIE
MARVSSSGATGGLLPAGALAFVRRRLGEAAGLILFVLALALLTALVTYQPSDPSFNSAGGGLALNLLGRPGAYTADLLLQSLGVAAYLPVLAFAVWGWKLVSFTGLRRFWIRVAMLPVSALLLALTLAVVPPPEGWPLKASLGGVVGTAFLKGIDNLAAWSGLEIPHAILALIVAVLAAASIVVTFGLAWSEWRAGGGLLARGAVGGAKLTARGLKGGVKSGWRLAGLLRGRLVKDNPFEAPLEEEVEPEASGRREPTLRRRPATEQPAEEAERDAEERLVLVDAPKPKAKPGKRADKERQRSLNLAKPGEYERPPLDLLKELPSSNVQKELSASALEQNARLLESVLDDFGIKGEIVKVRPGPVVTLYELEPAPGTKTSRVISLADDIARSMSAVSVRVAVIPGRNVIGLELPNSTRSMVGLRELLSSDVYERDPGNLTLALGKDIGGTPIAVDLARMPHLLIAGTTGSGKSVAMNTMILSLLYGLAPADCRFIMIDPKMLELSVYDGIPHLLCPVVTEPSKAIVALKWTVREMEDRYRSMSQLGVRNIAGYNARLAEAKKRGETLTRRVQTGFDPETGKPVVEEQALKMEPLPLIVVVVDEMADLMLVAGKDIEAAVQRLAQMARAAGIHMIMATQRPSVDVITGTIKANFPTRISFQVTSKIDSRTILGEQGAEQLLGQGDMLYMAGGGRITRVHGPFVSDEEVERVVSFLKAQGEPEYVEEVTREDEEALDLDGEGGGGGSGDDLYDQAVAIVTREGKASTSFVQRHLQIGYNRAARIIERMEKEGVISEPNRVGRREVLAQRV